MGERKTKRYRGLRALTRSALMALLCIAALLFGACSNGAGNLYASTAAASPVTAHEMEASDTAASNLAAGDTDAAAVKLSLRAQPTTASAPAGKTLSDEELSRLTILTLDSSLAMIGGEVTDLVADQPALYPYLRESKTYVPLEFVEKGLGAEASQNEDRGMLHIRSGGELVVSLNSAEYDYAQGRDYDAYTLYVPLRRVAEALGKSVGYYDGLIVVGDSTALDAGVSPIDSAQLAELRRILTGATAVGSEDKLGKLLGGVYTNYYGSFDNHHAPYKIDVYEDSLAGRLEMAADAVMDSVGGMFGAAGAPAPTEGGGTGGMASSGASASSANAAPDRDSAVAAADGGSQRAPSATAAPTAAAATTAAAAAPAGEAYTYDEAEMPAEAQALSGATSADATSADGGDYSGTNVQVEGVDESDVVKTDGRYIYQVNGQRILIIDAYPPSGMKKVGQVEYEQSPGHVTYDVATGRTTNYDYASEDGISLWPREMYVDGDTMVIIGDSQRSITREAPRVNAETETGEDGVTRDEVTAGGGAGVAPAGMGIQPGLSVTPSATAAPREEAPEADIAASGSTAAGGDIAASGNVDVVLEPSGTYVVSVGFLSQTTRVLVYDIKDRTAPKLIRDSEIDGNYQSSRKIGGALYLIVNQPLYYNPWFRYGGPATGGAEALPDVPAVAYRDSASAVSGAAGFTNVDYSNIYYFPGCVAQNYLVVAGIDTRDAEKPVSVHALLDNGQNVYASSDYLYVASMNYRPRNWYDQNQTETTAVHRFKLNDGAIEYDGRGEVNGSVLNQFSMDESGGYFRIATTSSSYDERNGYVSRNNLYILDGGLKIVGKLEGLAPGEQIYSARFIGTRGYIVTFKTVDPLFVIDLADPTNPTVLGSLKIPGYSDYLHPYDENHIIGFGKDTTEYSWGGDQTTALYQGMKVALFDVSDVANPVELFKTEIGDRGTDSQLLYNHRALLFSKERGLLAFPVTVATIPESQKTGDPKEDMFTYGQFEFQGAYVYDLNLTDGFTLKGRITHISDAEYSMYGSDYWNQDGNGVDRLLYIRDTLYALSQKYITAHDMNNPATETGRVALD